MKIYLASYTQSHNHGPGRKIAVATTKPDSLKVSGAFVHVIPTKEMLDEYKNKQLSDPKEAALLFRTAYSEQLEDFFKNVKQSAQVNNTSIIEQLPLQDGDSLLSWEREGYTSYRPLLATFLEKAGYEIILK